MTSLASMARALEYLRAHSRDELLALTGRVVPELALQGEVPDKRYFPRSYGGGKPCDDDLLTGLGAFYVTQAGRLMLDGTSGHYQMTWGYNHPELNRAVTEALAHGIVWDNHSNTPSLPVKELSHRLVRLAGEVGLDRVLLGVCTGSVAAEAALKIAMLRYERDGRAKRLGPPVILTLKGNYHGTGMSTQVLRGMWPGLISGLESVQVEPNRPDELEAAFRRCGERVAAAWAEPIMMNREAMEVDPAYLRRLQELCRANNALLIIDEIQTGFWVPEVFHFRRLGLAPDLVVIGKGMTAGFHPLAGLLYRQELDILEQYDAISTNGNASLAAWVSLANLDLIAQHAERMARLAQAHQDGLRALARKHADTIEAVNGSGYLTGLKFRSREAALECHRAALERGLWLRVHAYYEGHRTLLMKMPLVFDEAMLAHLHGVLDELLARRQESVRSAGRARASAEMK